ncbi:FKBP-type peptidyl-prolyl cis-trans isomerase [Marinobacterium sediminicola]|uniref:Peptidyl-prolyl cis-trans isomerase n=1 Tax=Marinobacterium sediminicola TaxID=518898 RepID=A0ABY1S3E4_9GAMM|nr:FKBP-type peptidyl-prolyl cis-trans isomerase [Marinobacterium sediminicola]ULG68157.1 FKBP-type peptidyl-prolyl cis-trans isomerase [Marinobacterium sediminicola]SMR77683.1 FKBP-type peptidyl-prolyl cis-trans isomerase FklB [Marinobacterium sediminicola]
MQIWKTTALALVAALLLGGCGEDPEQERLRLERLERALNDDTRKAGDAFLAENAKREGVEVLDNGLQIEHLVKGAGASPTAADTVVVHYEGKRVDGHVFDSSYERGEPTQFPLKQVVRGWRNGLIRMQEGGTAMLYLPPEQAYGATSPSPEIPANSTLIFKVELVEVIKNEDAR